VEPLKDPAAFARDLVENAVAVGFGSLSKRDLELLVFWLLERDGVLPREATNHEIARRLSVTVAKARAFRRDADARWGRLDPASQRAAGRVPAVLQRVLEPRALEAARRHTPAADRADGFVGLLVGHPADREFLEQLVLDAGGVPRTGRHPDVLLVRFDVLVAVASKHLKATDVTEARKHLKGLGVASEELEAVLRKNVSELRWEDLRTAVNAAGAKLAASQLEGAVGKLFAALFPALRR
jgi:hypothetical protein